MIVLLHRKVGVATKGRLETTFCANHYGSSVTCIPVVPTLAVFSFSVVTVTPNKQQNGINSTFSYPF